MPNETANRLKKNINKILLMWEDRVNKEIEAARPQDTMALRDSLPEFLKQIADALSNTIDRTSARRRSDQLESTRLGKRHGEDRTAFSDYTIDQLITEYHILRQVLCDVMEDEAPLTAFEREVIVSSIEQAVNDAATEYSEILKKMRERMSTTLTHDLRNPLTSAKISAQLVLRKLSADDASVSKMKLIIRNMDRLDQMITGVLDASRLKAGESVPIDVKFCDLDKIVREVTDELSLANPDSFKVESTGNCPGYWDENGLRRVIENLVTNAVKYGDENKYITISLTHDQTSAKLIVHNFGNPIPPEDIPVLFEQYRRLKSDEDKAGWGLGLTMVKGMVDAHKGSIQVESEMSKGTSFIINLPKDAGLTEVEVPQIPQVQKTEHQERSQ
jgi:signal transduction histidine kinase